MKNSFLIVFALTVFMNFAQASVWNEENQWSDEWEAKYRIWVKENANTKIFANEKKANGEPNPYYGIHVDCAVDNCTKREPPSCKSGIHLIA
jgi:hypothetical protein